MGKRKSKLKLEYMKQRKRIQNFKRRAQKRGYVFNFDIEPIPEKIKRSDVTRLKKMTPEEMYKASDYFFQNGKSIPGLEGRKLERSISAQKSAKTKKQRKTRQSEKGYGEKTGKQTDFKSENVVLNPPSDTKTILHFVEEQIESWSPSENWTDYVKSKKEEDKNQLHRMLQSAISQFGEEEIAKRLEENATAVKDCVMAVLYESRGNSGKGVEITDKAMTDFSRILFQSVIDVETGMEMTDYAEYYS